MVIFITDLEIIRCPYCCTLFKKFTIFFVGLVLGWDSKLFEIWNLESEEVFAKYVRNELFLHFGLGGKKNLGKNPIDR